MILRLTVTLGSPVVWPQSGYLLGDALLFAALARQRFPNAAERTDPRQWEPLALPVTRGPGEVPAVSAWIAEPPVAVNTLWAYKRSEAAVTTSVAGKPEEKSGPLQASRVPLRALWPTDLHCFLEFAPDQQPALQALLEVVMRQRLGLGRYVNRGYGRIAAVHVSPEPRRSSAILDPDGRLLRPVPRALYTFAPHQAIQGQAICRPPYFAGIPEPAWLPLAAAIEPDALEFAY